MVFLFFLIKILEWVSGVPACLPCLPAVQSTLAGGRQQDGQGTAKCVI